MHHSGDFSPLRRIEGHQADILEVLQRSASGAVEHMPATPERGLLKADITSAVFEDAIDQGAANEMLIVDGEIVAYQVFVLNDFQCEIPDVQVGLSVQSRL